MGSRDGDDTMACVIFGAAPTAIDAVPRLTVFYESPQKSLQAFDE
jgi:hypothetical protein